MIDISHDFLQILDYVHEFVSHSDGELHKWDTFIYIYIYLKQTGEWRLISFLESQKTPSTAIALYIIQKKEIEEHS